MLAPYSPWRNSVWKKCTTLVYTLPCKLLFNATLMTPLNRAQIIVRTTTMDPGVTATIRTTRKGMDNMVVHALMVPRQQLPLSLSPMATISTPVSLGMEPTLSGCTSLPLPYISVDSPHRTFKATKHPRLVLLGSHFHNFPGSH